MRTTGQSAAREPLFCRSRTRCRMRKLRVHETTPAGFHGAVKSPVFRWRPAAATDSQGRTPRDRSVRAPAAAGCRPAGGCAGRPRAERNRRAPHGAGGLAQPSGSPRRSTTMHPGSGPDSGRPHSSHERASAEPVPAMPAWPRHQLTNDEHHGALSSYPQRLVCAWYSPILGLLWPAGNWATPTSAIATVIHGRGIGWRA